MKAAQVLWASVLLSALSGTPVLAGPNANAKIQFHVVQGSDAYCNDGLSLNHPRCHTIRTAGDLWPRRFHYVYVLVTDGNASEGVGGLSFGLDYDETAGGVDLTDGWAFCASTQSRVAGINGPWPASGSGNTITWDESRCQDFEPGGAGTGVTATAGVFYCAAYTPDDLRIVVHPISGLATVSDCSAVVDTVEGGGITRVPGHLGFARFSEGATEPGYSPCGLNTSVENTSWGRIKSSYR